uniref:ATPase family AAA domain-containing protein 5 n=1 Tax=Strongyloides venezuelensis TaxID=75913 RepID=A0A0K0EWC3_STRVS
MSGKGYLNSVISDSLKQISKRLDKYSKQKPWRYQAFVNKIKQDVSESSRSISHKTVKSKKRTPPKKRRLPKLSDKKDLISNEKKGTKKESPVKKKRMLHFESKNQSPISEPPKGEGGEKKKPQRQLRRKCLLTDKNVKDDVEQNIREGSDKKKVKKQEKKKVNDSYRISITDIISHEEESSNPKDVERSEEKKRREKQYTKKRNIKSPKRIFCVDGKDPDEEFRQKLKNLDIPIPISNTEGVEEKKLSVEELALNFAKKNPRSSISAKILGPYEIESIEEAHKKHPNVMIIPNKNLDGKVMNDLKRPFWHQVDPIPLLMGRQEDPTDDTLPINSDMLKSFEQGKLKIENSINLRPKQPNPFGSLKEMINQNPMFNGYQIFANTMRNIIRFRPKHLRSSQGKFDSILMLEVSSQEQLNKTKVPAKLNPLTASDDNTAEEELESSSKKLQKEAENTMFPVMATTKIVYKRSDPCNWKEVPLCKKSAKAF